MRFDNAARLYLLSILYGGASATLNCDIHVDGISFDLKPLTGTHKINSTLETPPSTSEFTWLFNPCSPVERNDASTPFSSKCPDGAQSMYIFSQFYSHPLTVLSINVSLK